MGSLLIAVIYLIFISLGLPDSLLGSGWPTMQVVFGVPSSYAGYVSMTICFMTILSALLSPSLIRRFHVKWIVAVSIFLTILGLFGFSVSGSYAMLFVFAVPYGLGAGSIDSAVNHYVANHYSGSIMNFLHCFYGVGAVISPYIMSLALRMARWNEGYRWTAYIQAGILLVVFLSFPLWTRAEKGFSSGEHGTSEKKIDLGAESSSAATSDADNENASAAGLLDALRVPGVVLTLIAFYAYCAGEATCFLWTPSYFAGTKSGLSEETIASFGSLIFFGLMLGRVIAGFVSNRLGDRLLIRIGIAVELIGIMLLLLPVAHYAVAVAGFIVVGTGMGPVYPAIQHMAPENFGKRFSAPVIGLQMASAYVGSTFMPLVFGILQQSLGIAIMPFYLLLFAAVNIGLLELSYQKIKKSKSNV